MAHGDFSPLCITNLFHTNVNFKVFFKIRQSEHALTRKLMYKGSRLFSFFVFNFQPALYVFKAQGKEFKTATEVNR